MKHLKFITSFTLTLFLMLTSFVFAENILLYENDHKNQIIIKSDSNFGNTTNLYFGESFQHALTWDSARNSFIFTDDVDFSNNEIKNVRLENNILANKTCNSLYSGSIYYNTSDTFSYVCNGSDWKKIDEENSGTGAKLQPYFEKITPSQISTNETRNVIITGGNFDEDTVFTIGSGITVNSITINSDSQATINVTSGNTEITGITIDAQNDTLDDFGQTLALNIIESTWSDLRSGGTVFTFGNAAGNDIRFRTGMSMARDANGMYFTGSAPWNSWVKFESLQWTRGENKTLQWIFTKPSSAIMIGIGSNATNESSSAQYAQSEINAYFPSSTYLWGLYGNNGNIGSAGNQNNSTNLSSANTYKIKFTNDGTRTLSVFTLYALPSANQSDWDDETNILGTFTVGGSLNPDETNIMPFIIPSNGGSQRFIAVKVE